METYFSCQIRSRPAAACQWSKALNERPLLAVALAANAVGIYNEDGLPLDSANEQIIKNVRASEAVGLAWHPTRMLLAIGWKDGAISLWNAEDRRLQEDSGAHRSSISGLAWDAAGERLVSTDDAGKVVFWTTDAGRKPVHLCHGEEPGSRIAHAVIGSDGATGCCVYYAALAVQRAVIKCMDDKGTSTIIHELSEELHALLHYPEREQLLCVTAGGGLLVLGREGGSAWQTVTKMKLASAGAGSDGAVALQVLWAGPHTLASASSRDVAVRLFNFDTQDNYTLPLSGGDADQPAAGVSCMAYDDRSGMLCAASPSGSITTYHHCGSEESTAAELDLSKAWEPLPPFQVSGRPTSVAWGPHPSILAVGCQDLVHACRKSMLQHKIADGVAAVQVSADSVIVEACEGASGKPAARLTVDMQIREVGLSRGLLLVHNGRRAEVHCLTEGGELSLLAQFDAPGCRSMAIYGDSVFRTAGNRVEVCNTSGIVKQTLPFDEAQGNPILLDINREFLAVCTSKGHVRVYKLSGREAKPHNGPALLLPADVTEPLTITAIRINSNGQCVSALASAAADRLGGRLFVCNVASGQTWACETDKDGRVPVSADWDTTEPRLLAVQTQRGRARREAAVSQDDTQPVADTNARSGAGRTPAAALEVATVFVTPEQGLVVQDYQRVEARSGAVGLLGVTAPFLLVQKKAPNGGAAGPVVSRVIMQGFTGLQDVDAATQKALLDFSFKLAGGQPDEAFKAVKSVHNPVVWQSMAHLCIKNKRLDVAEHCLGKMEHARGARAVRESRDIPELDARVGMVAVHLDMMEDAKRLFQSCGRWDLLCNLHAACGEWEEALAVAEKHDRIQLKTRHYQYAQQLEMDGDYMAAMDHYQKSGTAAHEVPRMLHAAGQLSELESYAARSDSKEVQLWWGRYCESQGHTEKALACYERSGNRLAALRLHCINGNFEAAEAVAATSGDLACAFHLARQYEAMERIPEAVRYYSLSGRYSHGARLARRYELDGELLALALKSPPAQMLEAADYLYEKGEYDKAAMLYQKGGKLGKAIEMCFSAQLFDVLQHIADQLQPDSDPALFARCGDFFLQHGHPDKAAGLLIHAKQYSRALDVCVQHDVAISEEMAEAMTPDKASYSASDRASLLRRIAQACKRQGSYHLACKKYTQAGDKLRAIKALIKSGDTEKIVFFAGVSRQPDVFLLAANYLQMLDWHADPELMKNIISFYSKAQAHDNLAGFYTACAQTEIDEYRDYEKALQAMQEAVKSMAKSRAPDRDQRMAAIQQRIALVERFVQARHLMSTEPSLAIQLCQDILSDLSGPSADVDSVVRPGDVYAELVNCFVQHEDVQQAHTVVERMQQEGIPLGPFLDAHVVQLIYDYVGKPVPHLGAYDQHQQHQHQQHHDAQQGVQEYGEGGFVEEDIPDEEEDM